MNRGPLGVVYGPVNRLFQVFAACLALLWVPMVSHCDLEHLPGMAFIACCEVAEDEPHQDSDCQTDVCATVESGHYKSEERSVSAPAPCLVAVLLLPTLDSEITIPASPVPDEALLRSDPPQRLVFTLRQALPSRAPSSVS